MTVPTLTDLDVVARTVYGEARGEPPLGRMAVAWVIRNRVETDLHGDGRPDWWGEGYEAVCKKRWQFSCWNEGDPNRREIERATVWETSFAECLAAAFGVLAGQVDDPTHGATHYHHFNVHPAWAEGQVPCARLFRHVFYRGLS